MALLSVNSLEGEMERWNHSSLVSVGARGRAAAPDWLWQLCASQRGWGFKPEFSRWLKGGAYSRPRKWHLQRCGVPRGLFLFRDYWEAQCEKALRLMGWGRGESCGWSAWWGRSETTEPGSACLLRTCGLHLQAIGP